MSTRVSLIGAVVVAAAVAIAVAAVTFAIAYGSGVAAGRRDARADARLEAADAALERQLVTETAQDRLEPDLVELPQVTLQVHGDGCGVIRPEMADEPHGLQWNVVDRDGFSVLRRNAAGETHFRYFGSGTFSLSLDAWDGETYSPISQVVTISC